MARVSQWIARAVVSAQLLFSLGAHAQGVLTLTPARAASTAAGTGAIAYTGDNGAATAATLASPSAVAYDGAGNLFIADTNNHVIREIVRNSGTIVTVAGTGAAGFFGDGGSATSAQLDTPTGVAVDGSGNLYIADSHNQRIRRVANGVIATVAGTGIAGFSGDSAAAIAAQLSLPSAVAVDSSGNLYIADTNNQRIRKVTGNLISTLAGTGEQSYTGDGSAATVATLDSPTGVAVDTAGNLYIADRHNQRVRQIGASGIITTLAGSGSPSFAGGFAGDGSLATSSTLSRPTGVSVDAAGNVYIADTNNQRIRQVSGSTIFTAAGYGDQGFAGDGASVNTSTLNAPRAALSDGNGNLVVADTLNERVRSAAVPTLAFGNDTIGVTSAAQTVTLGNSGAGALTVSSTTLSGPFAFVPGGTCSAAPVTLAPQATCTEMVAFVPTANGAATGAVSFSGTGIATQSLLLAGTGVQVSTTTALTSSAAAPFINQPVTFTATVKPTTGAVLPNGNVTFYNNGVAWNTVALTNGSASLTTSFPLSGSYAISAVYTGNTSLGSSTSATLTQVVGDFNFMITPGAGSGSQTVMSGQAVTYNLSVAPLNGPFTFPITLSASGLPPGATVSFSPSTLTLGSSVSSFTMTVQTAKTTAALWKLQRVGPMGGMAFVLVLLPFAGRRRRLARSLKLCAVGFVSFLAIAGLAGCGTGSGFFGQQQQTYTISVYGTATGANGLTLQHVSTVQITVQ